MKDIYNIANEVKIEGQNYKLEFDNRAYATVENILGKGTFKIFQGFVLDNNLQLEECIKVFCTGMMKHHKQADIEKVKKVLEDNPSVLHKNLHALQFSFAKPLILPDSAKECMTKKAGAKKKPMKTA